MKINSDGDDDDNNNNINNYNNNNIADEHAAIDRLEQLEPDRPDCSSQQR